VDGYNLGGVFILRLVKFRADFPSQLGMMPVLLRYVLTVMAENCANLPLVSFKS
jgi:hypothetical protein